MIYKFFDKKSKGSGIKNEIKENQKLANELHKLIIRNFKRRKVYVSSFDGTWVADLADMQLISKYNKGIRYLLCVIDIFSKYAWAVPLKDKKGTTIANALQKILDDSKRKPNKIWVDQGSEFYNNVFKKWLKDNNMEMYSTHNEGKSVVAERYMKTLKHQIYKHMTAVSKNVYFDVLDNIVGKYNNTYHRTIKIKPKHKNIFAKKYFPNWNEEIFVVKKIKNTVPWTYVISDLNGEEVVGSFYEKELQKTN